MEGQEAKAPARDGQGAAAGRWSDLRLLAVLLVAALAVRAWLLGHTEVAARDSIGYIRYALQFEEQDWRTVIRHNHQHPGYPLTVLTVSIPVRALCGGTTAEAMQLSAQLASALAAVLLVRPCTTWARSSSTAA